MSERASGPVGNWTLHLAAGGGRPGWPDWLASFPFVPFEIFFKKGRGFYEESFQS